MHSVTKFPLWLQGAEAVLASLTQKISTPKNDMIFGGGNFRGKMRGANCPHPVLSDFNNLFQSYSHLLTTSAHKS